LAREVGNVDYTAVYQSVRRLEARAQKDRKLLKVMQDYAKRLNNMYDVKT